jgi:hypothetical protein
MDLALRSSLEKTQQHQFSDPEWFRVSQTHLIITVHRLNQPSPHTHLRRSPAWKHGASVHDHRCLQTFTGNRCSNITLQCPEETSRSHLSGGKHFPKSEVTGGHNLPYVSVLLRLEACEANRVQGKSGASKKTPLSTESTDSYYYLTENCAEGKGYLTKRLWNTVMTV